MNYPRTWIWKLKNLLEAQLFYESLFKKFSVQIVRNFVTGNIFFF